MNIAVHVATMNAARSGNVHAADQVAHTPTMVDVVLGIICLSGIVFVSLILLDIALDFRISNGLKRFTSVFSQH